MDLKLLKWHIEESIWISWFNISNKWISQICYNLRLTNTVKILNRVDEERKCKKIIYPAYYDTFRALEILNNPLSVKVIIIGQDPYHGPNQANGLAFSVKKGQPIPPSLKNIFIELKNDLGIEIPDHGDLTSWAKQGVLLLNTSLTVEEHKPGSHANYGWKKMVEAIIKCAPASVVGILWGKHAQKFDYLFTTGRIISSAHPSPLSASKGFFGSKPFSRCNSMLEYYGGPIDWSIK